MKADITRDSFHPGNDYSRVLMQQGRLQLDADWNEQVSIFWHFLRTFTCDLVGPYGGPANGCGFAIITTADFEDGDGEPMRKELGIDVDEQKLLRSKLADHTDFLIGPGRYYVDGILCNNPDFIAHSHHSHIRAPLSAAANSMRHLVYLDVWERFITPIEDGAMREPALNGIETCARSKVLWQVKIWKLREGESIDDAPGLLAKWQSRHRGSLRARARHPGEGAGNQTSSVASDARYRGVNNQLYRVEVHHGGRFGFENETPTFKWSRENGSVVFPIVHATDDSVTLASLGRDARSGLRPGNWVEILDDDLVLENRADSLRQVADINIDQSLVTFAPLGADEKANRAGRDPAKHPLLRRWDHRQGDPRRGGSELHKGAVLLKEGDGEKFWLMLENGVEVQFKPAKPQQDYRTGDFWLIPARVATGDVEWPQLNHAPQAIPPQGVEHVLAPLAVISFTDKNKLQSERDFRPKFKAVVSGY